MRYMDSKTWAVAVWPNHELYVRWLEFNRSYGKKTAGRGSEISRINTELFEQAIIKAMEVGNVAGN